MRSRLLVIFLAACSGGTADSSGPGGGGTSDAGGGVSFGGAQDIGEFRSILERGEIPGTKTLDANGFFNEHFNEPPDIQCGGTLCLTPGLSVFRDWMTDRHQAALQVSINTHIDPTQYERLPMKLVVVVDHSGSMASDDRLEKVKAGLHTLIDNLKPEDRLAIISFDDYVTNDAAFTTTKAQKHAAVTALQPGGGTNIYDGLSAGFALLGDVPASENQNRIIFLSDGIATVGNTSQDAIIEMATGRIATGIGLTTIGVGNDFDVELMRGLAERGAGNFYYVEDATAATEVFTQELDYFLSPIALDLRIEATAAPGWEFKNVVGSTLWQAAPTSGSMQVPAVFLASRMDQGGGEPGRRGGGSMIFIHLNPLAHEAGKVADLVLSYRVPGQADRVTHTVSLDYQRDPQEMLEQPYLSNPEMAERYAMYNAFLGFKAATEYAAFDWNCASAALAATRRHAQAWTAGHEADLDLAADIVLMDKFLANLGSVGATSEDPSILDACAAGSGPGGNPGGDGGWGGSNDWPPYGEDDGHGDLYCSAGDANPTWLLVLGAIAIVTIRRRRRR